MQKKYVAVTGAAGALGRVVARTLARRGWAVIAIDVAESIPDPEGAALQLPGIDLTSFPRVIAAFDRIGAECGALHALVNIAGGFVWETIETGSPDVWDHMYNLNLRTALNAAKAALPLLLRQGGSILNISAAASVKADTGMGAYAASKSAVARLTESLAAETKDKGIRVNAVLPSIIDTPANRAAMPSAKFDLWVSTDALADVIAFLISNDARAITGALIPVTGRV